MITQDIKTENVLDYRNQSCFLRFRFLELESVVNRNSAILVKMTVIKMVEICHLMRTLLKISLAGCKFFMLQKHSIFRCLLKE